MNWHLTIFDAAETRIVFHAKTSRDEAELLAAEALHQRPELHVYLRDPRGSAIRLYSKEQL